MLNITWLYLVVIFPIIVTKQNYVRSSFNWLIYNIFHYTDVPFIFAVWYGVIFLRQGPYQEGIFRFNVHIPENYPDGEVPVFITYFIFISCS